MRPVEFYFSLAETFKKGIDVKAAKAKRDEGKNVDNLYNPFPTSINLGCTVNGTYLKVNTGIKLRPAEYDFENQEPSRKCINRLEYKTFLQTKKAQVEREVINLRTNNEEITPDVVKGLMQNAFGGLQNSSSKKSFWEVYEEFKEYKGKTTKNTNISKYNSLVASLKKFEKKYYPLSFEKMTINFFTDFMSYSTDKLKHKNNTIGKNLKLVKVFLTWCWEHPKKYNKLLDYKKFKVENDMPEPLFLTQEELEMFEAANTEHSKTQTLSKMIFIYQCYTGQRIGDVLNLRKQDIRLSKNGEYNEWVLYQGKGNKKYSISIPILDKAQEILDKYFPSINGNDRVFPPQTNVMINKNLKIIGLTAGIDTIITKVNYSGVKRVERTSPKYKFISTHMARKTFITLSLEKGMRDEQIITFTGHTSIRQLRPYVGTEREKRNSDLMEKWNKGKSPTNDKSDTPIPSLIGVPDAGLMVS